jgi:hypothetical protein
MTIDTSQNVGLGVTPSAWSNYKAIQMGGGVGLASYTAGAIILNLGTNQYYNGTNYVYVNTDFAASYQQVYGIHKWWTAASGTAGNAITFTQSLALGKGTTLVLENGTSSSGTGIAFPATQNPSSEANTLDDYEEGTWTPSIIGSASNPSIVYGIRYGQYTKVGRLCYFVFGITGMSSYSGGSGRVLVTGLPFTAAASQTGNGAPANTLVSYMTMTSGYTQITNYVDPSTTNVNWLETGTGVPYHDMTVGQFQTATTFIVSGFYIVA